MIAFSISGGGGRFLPLLALAMEREKKGFPKADVYAGVSAGWAVAMCDVFDIKQKVFDLVSSGQVQWLKKSPVTPNGNLSWFALKQLLLFRNHLGIQQEEKYLKQWITPEMWNEYIVSDKPPVWGLSVCVETEEPVFWNAKEMSYKEMLLWGSSTMRVPLWVQDVLIDGLHYADGGPADHNPSAYLLDQYPGIKELWSFWTSPYIDIKYPKGLLGMIKKVTSIQNSNNTSDDEETEQLKVKIMGVKYNKLRIKDYMTSPYDTDPSRLAASVKFAIEQFNKTF